MTEYCFDFEWDEEKAATNVTKHGISFEEAVTVFDDPFARVVDDPDHSELEERFVILGTSLKAKALVVCHCFRKFGSSIRIIFARKATRNEETTYWRYRHEN